MRQSAWCYSESIEQRERLADNDVAGIAVEPFQHDKAVVALTPLEFIVLTVHAEDLVHCTPALSI